MQTRSQLRGVNVSRHSRNDSNIKYHGTEQQQLPSTHNPVLKLDGSILSQDTEDTKEEEISINYIQPSRRTSFLPQRTSSVRKADPLKSQATGSLEPLRRHLSPTKATSSSLQRSQSMKQWGNAANRPARTHQRQSSIDGTTAVSINADALRANNRTEGLRSGVVIRPVTKNAVSQLTMEVPDVDNRVSNQVAESASETAHIIPRAPSHSNAMLRKRRPKSMIVMTPQHKSASNQSTQTVGAITVDGPKLSGGHTQDTVAPQVQRPDFSTLQNHFTPQRTVKPPTSSFLAKPSTEQRLAEKSIREKSEAKLALLHLHLVHRDSASVQEQWKSSAKSSYSRRFEGLATSHKDLLLRESSLQEQVNVAAIMAWCRGTANSPIDRNIRQLSAVVTEVCDLSVVNGKYTGVIQDFEHWHSRASRTRELRNGSHYNASSYVDVIEGIGDGWKAEAALLNTKLVSCAETLQKLGHVPTGSDLARCLNVLSMAVNNMLAELDIIQAIESQMVEQEEIWIKTSINHIAVDLTHDLAAAIAIDVGPGRYSRR